MKAHLLAIITILCISCSNEQEINEYYSHDVSEKFSTMLMSHFSSNDSFPLPPPPILHETIYVRVKNDSVCKTDILYMYYVFTSTNKKANKSFEAFLYNAMNQKTEFETSLYFYPNECFKPHPDITNSYKHLSLNEFMTKYCEQTQIKNKFTFKDFVKTNTNYRNSVAYYLYLNKYSVGFDDYMGSFYIYPYRI